MESSRTVVENLMRGRSCSRMGLWENIWKQTLRKWIGQGYPVNDKGNPVDPATHFDYDLCPIGGSFDNLPLRGYREIVEETDEWQIIRNGSGAKLKHWKIRAGTPEHIYFEMTSRKVWEEKYRPHMLTLDRERLAIEGTKRSLQLRRKQGRWAMFGSLFIFEHMRRSLGDVCMYESFLSDPEWINDYCSVVTEFFIMHFKVMIEEAGRPDGVRICEDLGYKTGLFCSPRSLAELVFPHYTKLVEFFHSYDIPVILHSCGGVEEALDLIVEAGFDALDPMERAAGCDPMRFADITKNKIVLMGGFDKRILEFGDREAIRSHAELLLNGIRKNHVRYIFAVDHSVSTNVDYDDYRYLLDVFRENRDY